MHKLYSASYDASVYLQQPDQNTGRDEVLEVGKLYYGSTKDIYRALIKFDTGLISASIVSGEITGSWKAFLNLKTFTAEEIPVAYTLYANAVSQSWTMGSGTKFDNVTTDGVSWKYRNGVDAWQSNVSGGAAVFALGTTGSANAQGGTWYTGSQASQSFDYTTSDVRMDVTDIFKLWLSGSLPNNGLIIRHGLTNESDVLDYGAIKFFSKETNTIYEPKLEIVWDNSTYVTGSLAPVTGSAQEGYKVVLNNLKSKYLRDSKVKIRVKSRDMFPLKSFSTTFEYDQIKYLPSGSAYYQLEDYISGDVIFAFDDYTKLSCDTTSNYFIMDLSTLSINRVYKLKIKIVESGISTVIDDKLIFEIV
jgi:hypothetical protein